GRLQGPDRGLARGHRRHPRPLQRHFGAWAAPPPVAARGTGPPPDSAPVATVTAAEVVGHAGPGAVDGALERAAGAAAVAHPGVAGRPVVGDALRGAERDRAVT